MARKISEIIKEMAKTILVDQDAVPSTEAAHVALLLSHVAWNNAIGVVIREAHYKLMLNKFEVSNPKLWKELKSKNYKKLIKGLINYKRKHYPHDHREIIVCGMRGKNVRVEWVYS